MARLSKLDANVVKAKADWRRSLTDSNASTEERRKARTAWKSAVSRRDRAHTIWLQERANRRQAAADRRKADDREWQEKNAERRKSDRTQGRRLD